MRVGWINLSQVIKIQVSRENANLKGQSHELRMRDFLPLGALAQ